jgi:hypothetical protein
VVLMRHPDLPDAEYHAANMDAARVHEKSGWYVVEEPTADQSQAQLPAEQQQQPASTTAQSQPAEA